MVQLLPPKPMQPSYCLFRRRPTPPGEGPGVRILLLQWRVSDAPGPVSLASAPNASTLDSRNAEANESGRVSPGADWPRESANNLANPSCVGAAVKAPMQPTRSDA